MKDDEKEVNKTEENGAKLTDEELKRVSGGKEQIHSADGNITSATFTASIDSSIVSK